MSQQERGSMPSIQAIADYWANRCLKCDSAWQECGVRKLHDTGNIDYETYRQHMARYSSFCDPGEPDCLYCEQFLGYTTGAIRAFHGRGMFNSEETSPECGCGSFAICREYPRARLDRAHMVPWSVCHENRVDNIVLLCHECHRINPEPSSPRTGRREYLDWVCTKRDVKAAAFEALRKLQEPTVIDLTVFLPAIMGPGRDYDRIARKVMSSVRQDWSASQSS
jgi:hypothetical protein